MDEAAPAAEFALPKARPRACAREAEETKPGAEKIKEADDLKEATAQKAAMAKAKVPLLTAVESAVNANPSSRAVSVYPRLQDGSATAEVTLLQGTTFKKVTEKLD